MKKYKIFIYIFVIIIAIIIPFLSGSLYNSGGVKYVEKVVENIK